MKFLSTLLIIGGFIIPNDIVYDVYGQDAPVVEKNNKGDLTMGENEWRENIKTKKIARNILFGAGLGGAVTGTVLIVAGKIQSNGAKSTPGCYSIGDNIYCNNDQSVRIAQDKIDQGKQTATLGVVTLLVGVGLETLGFILHRNLTDLQENGQLKGFRLSVDSSSTQNIQIAYIHRF